MLLSRLVRERTLAEAFEGPIRGYPLEAFQLPASGLLTSIHHAGLIVLADAMTDFAPDIVARMDLYKAGKSQRSLGAFLDDLRRLMADLSVG